MSPDQINASFELVAGLLITFNVLKLRHDKKTRGVSIVPLAFMVIWGLWNCYFYPSLGVMWSFWCGLICTTVNGVWICQMIYYRKRENNDKGPRTKIAVEGRRSCGEFSVCCPESPQGPANGNEGESQPH